MFSDGKRPPPPPPTPTSFLKTQDHRTPDGPRADPHTHTHPRDSATHRLVGLGLGQGANFVSTGPQIFWSFRTCFPSSHQRRGGTGASTGGGGGGAANAL